MLSLPFAFARVGWAAGFMLLLSAIAFIYTMWLICRTMELLRTRRGVICDSYHSIARHTLGTERLASLVVLIVSIEMLMAMVLFSVNISLNLQTVTGLSTNAGIATSWVITTATACFQLKYASMFAQVGDVLTLLIVVALVASSVLMEDRQDSLSASSPDHRDVEFSFFEPRGLLIAWGIICFCFGGCAAVPMLFAHMRDPNEAPKLFCVAGSIVFTLLAVVGGLGYFSYGQWASIPITESIGTDLLNEALPYGKLLHAVGALGVVFNLQTTCPLVLLTTRDLISTGVEWYQTGESTLKSSNVVDQVYEEENTTLLDGPASRHNRTDRRDSAWTRETWTTLCISCIAFLLSITARDQFVALSGLCGSILTMTTSIFLPIIFYHLALPTNVRSGVVILCLHASLILLAMFSCIIGTVASCCSLLEIDSTICAPLRM
jgi:hypothetical protein